MNCFLCKAFIHKKEIRGYKLDLEVGLTGGGDIGLTIDIDCNKTPLCVACAMQTAKQGLTKLCEPAVKSSSLREFFKKN